ncbi:MAG TPA: hypothetical protein PLW80_06125, partial [Spirochaetales bacterium]|nr:hypothetical protein [Spirochaetales bacterium]
MAGAGRTFAPSSGYSVGPFEGVTMAQARKLSGRSGEYADAYQVLLDHAQVEPWAKTRASRRWGESARPKPGDLAVFVSKGASTPFFEHVALCRGGG